MAITVLSGGSLVELNQPLPWPSVNANALDLYGATADYETLWRTQPAVRTVVTFLARNIAQLGLHVFRRTSDTERVRVTDHPLARTLNRPNPYTTRYRLIHALIEDLGIYDRAYWLKLDDGNGGIELRRLPPRQVHVDGNMWGEPTEIIFTSATGQRRFDPNTVVHFRGYNPTGVDGVSPMETLRRILAEEAASGEYREQYWANAARIPGVIERPMGAPMWSDTAAARFKADWSARYSGQGPNAGGTPVLEDGMSFKDTGFSARDSQYLENRKLNREEVASAYFVPPPMVGLLDRATFSNITEQHKNLYQDTIAPRLVEIEGELGLQLVPEYDDPDLYAEFNLAEKLKGTFEEQAAVIQTMVGAPVLTRNEARARLNLPHLDGADELVTPLNVLVGGLASPRDTAPKALVAPRGRVIEAKATSTTTRAAWQRKHVEVLQRFFRRQRQVVLSNLGKAAAPVDAIWDQERWDSELAADLFPLGVATASAAALEVLARWNPDFDWSDEPMYGWLRANARNLAKRINLTTRDRLAVSPDDPEFVRDEFDDLIEVGAEGYAETRVTTLENFGRNDAAQATGLGSKMWTVRSSNPRESHAAMDGETVAIGETFSNGALYPGDPSLPAEESARCQCVIEFAKEPPE